MDMPVQRITWYEAIFFANLLSIERQLTPTYFKDDSFSILVDATNYNSGSFFCDFDASGYRLPTEGEWEHFARGDTQGPFSISEPAYDSGNCSSCTSGLLLALESVAVFCANQSGGPNSVGSKHANPLGLKDVHGNVWERCWDWHGDYPVGSATDYSGSSSSSIRVERGGSWWAYPAWTLRSAVRSGNSPGVRVNYFGFRLVRTCSIQ